MTEPLNETLDEPVGVVDPQEIQQQEEGELRATTDSDTSKREGGASLGQGGFGTVDEHSGGFSYSVNVFVPPPKAPGPLPYLALNYNSLGSGRESPSLIGVGWKLETGRIERVGKFGQTVNFENDQGQETAIDHFALVLSGSTYTLVKLQGSENRFFIKNEQFFAEVIRVMSDEPDPDSVTGAVEIDHWLLFLGDGKRYRYGVLGGAGAQPVAGQLRNKIWNLAEVENSFGFKVVYEYELDDIEPDPERPEVSFSYPSRVKIGVAPDDGPHESEVLFHYVDEEPTGGDNGYYRLGIDFTGRRANPFTDVRCIIRRRLESVESRFRDVDGKFKSCRRLDIEGSQFDDRIRIDTIQEVCVRDNGKTDKSCTLPPFEFTYISKPPDHPALIETATSPLGTISKIEYALATDLEIEHGTADIDDVMYLVKSRTEIIGEESWTTGYVYFDVKQYLPFGKEFRGHSRVIATDLTTKEVTDTKYDQTGVWNGRVVEASVFDGAGKCLRHSRNKLRALKFGGGRFFPFVEEAVERNFAEDGKTVLSTKVKIIPSEGISEEAFPWGYPIDRFGNFCRIDTQVFSGDRKKSNLFHEHRTEIVYENRVAPERPRFIGLRLSAKEIARQAGDIVWTLVSWEESEFDQQAMEVSAHAHFDSADESKVYSKYKEYDPQTGLLLRRMRGEGKDRQIIEEIEYFTDGPYRHLPRVVRNAKGQESKTLHYDLRFVIPTEAHDRNGFVARTSFDGYGRKLEELFGPHEATLAVRSGKNSVRHTYVVNRKERSFSTTNIHTGTSSKIFYDSLAREVRTEGTGYQGRTVMETIEYDPITRAVHRRSLPFYEDEEPAGFAVTTYERIRHRVATTTEPNGAISRYCYDGLKTRMFTDVFELNDREEKGKKLNTELASETTVDALGRTVFSAEGHPGCEGRFEVARVFDADNRLVAVHSTDGTQFQWTDFGTRIDGNAVGSYEISLGHSTFDYDRFGRLETIRSDFRASLDRVTAFTYDDLDRVTGLRVKDTVENSERVVKTCYDTAAFGIGAISSQTVTEKAARGTFRHGEHFSYDSFGHPTGKRLEWDIDWPASSIRKNLSLDIGFEHDGDRGGRLRAITFPGIEGVDRKQARYEYDDASGYLQSLTYDGDALWEVGLAGYNEDGAVLETRASNGTSTRFEYGRKDRAVHYARTERSGNALFEQRLTLDTAGNVRQRGTLLHVPGGSAPLTLDGAFDYDEKNQLTEVSEGNLRQTFVYRKDGSRDHAVENGACTSYHYEEKSPHQLSRLSGSRAHAFSYDRAGNLVTESNQLSGARRELEWSAGNRLNRAIVHDAESNVSRALHYAASASGRRAFMFDETKSRAIFYDDQHFDVEWDLNTDTLTLNNHVSNSARRVATSILKQCEAPKLFFPHRDQVQSVSAITNGSGEVAAIILYEPFGRIVHKEGDFLPDRLFTDQRAEMIDDEGFALYDFGARWYDPGIGAFISPDPHEDGANVALGYNRYAYVGNNPLNATDPTGHNKRKKSVALIFPDLAEDLKTADYEAVRDTIMKVASEVREISRKDLENTEKMVGYLEKGKHSLIFDHGTGIEKGGKYTPNKYTTSSGVAYYDIGTMTTKAGNDSCTLMVCRGKAGEPGFVEGANSIKGQKAPTLYSTKSPIFFTDQGEFVTVSKAQKVPDGIELHNADKAELVSERGKKVTTFRTGKDPSGTVLTHVELGKGNTQTFKKAGGKVLKAIGGPVTKALDVYGAVQDGMEIYNMARKGEYWNMTSKSVDVVTDYVPVVSQAKGVYQGVYSATRWVDEKTNNSMSGGVAKVLEATGAHHVIAKIWNWWDGTD